MSTSPVKPDPDAATTASSATPTPAPIAANMSAGTPVQTYPSPAHAQWAASQMVIDPQLQQSTTSSATTPKPLTTVPATTPAQAAAAAAYYSAAYQHYPQHYQNYQSYLTQAQLTALQQQQQQHSATMQNTPASVATTHRTSFSVATTPAPPTPVTAAHIPAAATSAAAANSSLDTSDIATLNDALGSAGVDLRAEEESLQRHNLHIPSHLQTNTSIYMQNRQYEDRSRKQGVKPAFNTQTLGTTMRTIGAEHKITRIPEDSVNYLALALRARMQDLITGMIEASRYRKEAQFDRPASMYETQQQQQENEGSGNGENQMIPMWSIVVRSDVAKQLAVLERVEREDELRIRRERKERLEMAAQHAANLAAQANGAMMGDGAGSSGMMGMGGSSGGGGEDGDGAPKKKKKKDGPGVTARNMSEDVRKKMSNAVATQAAGLGKYSWMTASSSASPAPKKAAAAAANGAGVGSGASSWARPYVPKKPQQEKTPAAPSPQAVEEDPSRITVTMRDAMFVVEKERGHGGGRGAAKGWR